MSENRIHPNYQGMLEINNRQRVENAVSETQAQLMAMDPGARWSHDVSHRVHSRGGNEGHFTESALEPDGEPHPFGSGEM